MMDGVSQKTEGTHRVHATALVYNNRGVLIRGASGAGKSRLAMLLLLDAPTRGLSAELIADDQVDLAPGPRGLIACAPVSLRGLIEVRGLGVVPCRVIEQGRIDLVVDLIAETQLSRMPDDVDLSTEIAGVKLSRQPAPCRPEIALPLILAALCVPPFGGQQSRL